MHPLAAGHIYTQISKPHDRFTELILAFWMAPPVIAIIWFDIRLAVEAWQILM